MKRSLTKGMAIAACVAASLTLAVPAHAKITTPTAGSTVSGLVFINEDHGGTEDLICGLGTHANSTITVKRLRDGATVLNQSKGSAGAWSTTWDSRQEPLDGDYQIKSTAKDATLGNFCGVLGGTKPLSDFVVHLQNFIPFVDDSGAGKILINPYLKKFQVLAGSYNSGVRSDPNMTFTSIPNAPAAPGLKPECSDPADPNFESNVLHGCFDPNPVPVLTIPPPTPPLPCNPAGDPTTCVPGPPNPPPPPCDPASNPNGCVSALPSQCQVTGCSDTAIVVNYSDDTLALQGAFVTSSHAFAADVALLAGGQPTGTSYQMSHTPPPPSA